MSEAPKTTRMQQFRDKLDGFYWLVYWIFWIFVGLAFPIFDLDPAWVGWILLILGVIGTISKGITLFVNSLIFILIDALDNFCLAIFLAIIFVISLINGGELTWALGAGAVVSAFLGTSGLKKYKKGKTALIGTEAKKGERGNLSISEYVCPHCGSELQEDALVTVKVSMQVGVVDFQTNCSSCGRVITKKDIESSLKKGGKQSSIEKRPVATPRVQGDDYARIESSPTETKTTRPTEASVPLPTATKQATDFAPIEPSASPMPKVKQKTSHRAVIGAYWVALAF